MRKDTETKKVLRKNDNMNRDMKRIDNCNAIKLVLMFCVVVCHSVSFWSGKWFTVYQPNRTVYALSILSGFTGSFHVYTFTLVSGYLFYYLRNEKAKYPRIVPFIIKKLKRLIVPYFFVAIVWAIPISGYFYKYTVFDVIKKYALGVSPDQLWFLLMLFWVYLMFYFLSKFVKNDVLRFSISVFFIFLGYLGNHLSINLFNIWTACQYLIYFEIGYLIRKYDQLISHYFVMIFGSIIFYFYMLVTIVFIFQIYI